MIQKKCTVYKAVLDTQIFLAEIALTDSFSPKIKCPINDNWK